MKIPRTKGSGWNALPDAGWWALQNSDLDQHLHIDPGFVNPAADIDSIQPAAKVHITSSGQFESRGRWGDGLTAFQEYRGFVVRGAHRRLNPHWKDLFLLPGEDEVIAELHKVKSLPLTMHRIRLDEAKLDPQGFKPEINFNRSASSEQRAVLLRFRDPGPDYQDASGNTWPAYVIATGMVHLDGQSYHPFTVTLDTAGYPVYPDLASPNGTMVAEVYPRNMTYQIWPGVDGTLDSVDGSTCIAQVWETSVPPGCDQYAIDEETGVVFIAQGDGVTDTPCHRDDECRVLDHYDCDSGAIFSTLDARWLLSAIAAHEVGHALNVYHSHDFSDWGNLQKYCGAIMTYDHSYPKKDFTTFEVEQVRIHENQ